MAELKPVFPWAAQLDADQLAAFLEELWGAAGGEDDLNTLKAVEDVIATWRCDVGATADGDELVPCPLTEREIDIVRQFAMGETIERAAANLGIATESVRSRLPQIYARIGAKNRAQATAIAAHHGWLPELEVPRPVELSPTIETGSRTWGRIYHERAAEMRRNPGLAVEIGPYTSQSGAREAARKIRKGHFDPFLPAGSFDAETVRLDGARFAIRAAFLGTTSTSSGDAV